ncbi:hypothetical protein D3867_25195 (plasmid) [Azospirillum argentinense]|uniref:Uncharacterized protein n=1 Tax=Azospirillum brasilense TaxID=192 RepID=A0A4D8QG22_AZOBR|nr:hypothetical protein D3867_25195 [Azospirillum argentinense]
MGRCGACCHSRDAFCPLPIPPPLRRGGDCRRFAPNSLSCEAGEGRGPRATWEGWGQPLPFLTS